MSLDDARISDATRHRVAAFILEQALEGYEVTLQLQAVPHSEGTDYHANFLCEGEAYMRDGVEHSDYAPSFDEAVIRAIDGWLPVPF